MGFIQVFPDASGVYAALLNDNLIFWSYQYDYTVFIHGAKYADNIINSDYYTFDDIAESLGIKIKTYNSIDKLLIDFEYV